ncbi:hypothetical protein [Paenibacillus sp. GCM10012306]|uniref:hypothetical protein n=1 Tax=Paenibacillus sp. GCM10012306 TaxID=3317342 RepID=UPI003605D8ED
MAGKFITVLLLASAMFAHDLPKFRKARARDLLVYGAFLVPLLYLAFIFVTAKSWPNLDSIFNVLRGPARQFIHWLNPVNS